MPAPDHDGLTLTFMGHACVILDVACASRADLRILVDPGNLASPLPTIDALDAVFVTHSHGDHVDAEQIARATGGAKVPVFGDAATLSLLASSVSETKVIEPGSLDLDGFTIDVTSAEHETIYPGVPLPTNYAYTFGGRVFAPGDSMIVPDFPVDVLLLPIGAPWMKLAEGIDYLRAVAPRFAIPIHDGGLAAPHRQLHRGLVAKFAPEGTRVVPLEIDETWELPA